ncbi:rhodanese-like domain-containing protein [Asticcacaulis sp. 201]|uniref:rhodanese-like domain-containing protein n=1 Tax=Asticcacaulis sp. 201 TaxID=3028787 RepID=UPI0029167B1F|nr:rhodanese-like domain-containing protein [Asticcacaulis sp. 201]MDV6329835.1 rhodanese-like domain-containing protein [Asticcacaulis sp. 201]
MSTPIENLTPEQVNAALDAGEILLVDVREPHEFAAERIAGAVNYPLSTLDPANLPSEAGKTVVLSCAGGVRSVTAANACQAAGIDIHHHLAGGLRAWVMAGLPTER